MPGDPRNHGLPAQPAVGADLARHARDLAGEGAQLIDHGVQRFLQQQDFAAHVDRDLARQIAGRDRGCDFRDVAHLRGEVSRHGIDVVGEVLPGAGNAGNLRLAAELALGADLAGHAGHFAGETVELVHHGIDGVLEFEDFALHVHRDLARQIAARHRRGHFCDVAHLAGEIRRHRIDVFSQILPCPGDPGNIGLPAQLALGADLARDPGDLRRKAVELVDHGIQGFFQLQDLAAHVHRDLARQVAVGDGGGDFGNVADLRRQVAGHRVDRVGQILPRTRDSGDQRLPAEAAFGADLAGHARHLAGERAQLIHHRIQSLLEEQDFARHRHGDFLRQVALRHGGGDLGDIADLAGQVGCHRVDRVGQILPGACHSLELCLTTELAFGADFARHPGHFSGESVQLVHHGVDGVLELEDFAVHVHRDFFRQVAVRHRGRDFRDVAHLPGEVRGHGIDVLGQILPGTRHTAHVGLAAEPALGADLARHARHFGGEGVQLVHHGIDGLFELQNFARDAHGDFLRQIAVRDGGRHLGDIAHLRREIRRHGIHIVGQVLPGAGDAGHLRLASQPALGADLPGNARDLAGKGVQLIHHGVHGLLEFEDFTRHIDRDLVRQVAARDGGGHLCDVADLSGEIAAHGVHRIGQILPGARDSRHQRLASQLALGADFTRHARDLGGEGAQLIHHGIDGFLQLQNLAAHVHGDFLRQITVGHGDGHLGNTAHLRSQIRRH